MKKIELLAPAGDLERLKIAYLYGADACYIGGKDYSLRANANNFSLDEMKEAVDYAHSLNKKLYVTVNIIFHNEDQKGIIDYLVSLEEIKVDGVIIADLYLLELLKKYAPKLYVIISTQLSVTNSKAVEFLLEKGADRIVLARETSKDEIKDMIEKTHGSFEVFLHGAMCACYSGRCVLSNYFTNRDSNRGGCAQVCRFIFDLDKKRDIPFAMATKDLNLARQIKDLIEIGVDSLKIEGRMRSAYYLATVIRSYRILIDAYYNNMWEEELVALEEKKLFRVANRDSSSQYFDHLANVNDQYYNGRCEISNQDFLAVVLSQDKDTKVALIEQRNYFEVGDMVRVFGPEKSFDMKIDSIKNLEQEEIKCANHPKEQLYIKLPYIVEPYTMICVKF